MNNQSKFLNKRISTPIGIIIIILTALLIGGILAWQCWWIPQEVISPEGIFPEEGVTTTHTYFKIKPLGIVSAPLLLGPADRYGCSADCECAYIIDNSDCDLLPENGCGNVGKYGFKIKNEVIQEPTAETIGGPPEEGIIIHGCDVSKIVIDPDINCECGFHKVLSQPCSTDPNTGEEVCVWIEDMLDYSFCNKKAYCPDVTCEDGSISKGRLGPMGEGCIYHLCPEGRPVCPEITCEDGLIIKGERIADESDECMYELSCPKRVPKKPDITITNLEFTPEELSVGEAYDVRVTIKNAGDSHCSSLALWVGPYSAFGAAGEISKGMIMSWCTHYSSLEDCIKNYPKSYAFLPGVEFTDKESCNPEVCVDNPLPGSYTVRAYAECMDPYVDSDWANNSIEKTITIFP